MGKRLCALFAALVLLTLPVCAFAAEKLPSAKVKEIVPVPEVGGEKLSYALRFTAEEPTEAQFNYYKDWYADFVIEFSKDIPLDDVMLAGQYDGWSEDSANWVGIPLSLMDGVEINGKQLFPDRKVPAKQPLKIMWTASELLDEDGLKLRYREVLRGVVEFNCGVRFNPEYLRNNPDFYVKLALRIYDPQNPEGEGEIIGTEYIWPPRAAAQAPDMPQTGDDANIALFAMLAAVSMIGLLAMNRSARSRKQN